MAAVGLPASGVGFVVAGYGLEPTSPCIDMGNDIEAPANDILGHARVDVPDVGIDDATYSDLGAFEFVP